MIISNNASPLALGQLWLPFLLLSAPSIFTVRYFSWTGNLLASFASLRIAIAGNSMSKVLEDLLSQLALERIEVGHFRGQSQDLGFGAVFGGQVMGQALSAAQQTVEPGRMVHSLHCYFIRPGDPRIPILFEVDRSRDGGSFTTRRVIAVQNGMQPDDVRRYLNPMVGLFVGGDTAWKESTCETWGSLARRRNCYLHVGRVNSQRRIGICAAAGADSFDGTSVTRYAVTMRPLDAARRQSNLFPASQIWTDI